MDKSLYQSIRLFFQPYWRPPATKPKPVKAKNAKAEEARQAAQEAKNAAIIKKHQAKEEAKANIKTFPAGKIYNPAKWQEVKGIYVNTVDFAPNRVQELTELPYPGHSWYYHNSTTHQLLTHVIPGRGFLYTNRSDTHRKNLKPLIYPKDHPKPFDRTHLIPFGYHGVEDDPRLLIGWDSEQNRGAMNTYEKKQKKRKRPFYWLVEVNRTTTGATLTYRTYDCKTLEELDNLELSMTGAFYWKD